jgi:uncharacterized membrane protein
MVSWYAVLKVVHVLAVVVWVGGALAMSAVTARYLRAGDRAGLAGFVQQSIGFGQRVVGPSSGIVLLSGIGMVLVGQLGFQALWVRLGFLGILLHFVFGLLIMRKRTQALAVALAIMPQDNVRVAAAGRALRVGTLVYLGIMAAVIVVMVAKPTL